MAIADETLRAEEESRAGLEDSISQKLEIILKNDIGEKSVDEDGVTTVTLLIEKNGEEATKLLIENYPQNSGNYTFIGKNRRGISDGFLILNKETGEIAGKEIPVGINLLREFDTLLSSTINGNSS